jgi:hypothetical protein
MSKTLMTVWLLAVLRYISGCCGPVPMDESAYCEPVTIAKIVDSPRRFMPNVLEVRQERDSAGRPFQTTSLLFASSEYTLGSATVFLALNGQRQVTTVWNGRQVGITRPQSVSHSEVLQCFCFPNVNFWRVPVGIGTVAEDGASSDPGFSVVGHPLTEGQELQVRLDICIGDSCLSGTQRTFRVHLIP